MRFVWAAILTVIVEGLVFMSSSRYRRRDFLLLCILVNLWSNVTLNTCLLSLNRPLWINSWEVLVGEAIVWGVEYLVYGTAFKYSWHLLLYVCLANGVTYGLGYLC